MSININFRQEGQGPDVILIHGLGQRLEDWYFQVPPLLKAGYRVTYYDMRGHGRSGWEDKEVDITAYAQDLHQLYTKLEIEKAHLVCLSMGTAVAQAFYGLYPEKVLSLVLMGGFAYFPEPIRSEGLKARLEAIDKEGMLGLSKLVAGRSFSEGADPALIAETASVIAANNQAHYRANTIVSISSDNRAVLPTITVPTLLIVGEGDITTPPELSQYLHENIKGSRLEIVPDARHIVNMEKPEIVNKLIIDFLQQN